MNFLKKFLYLSICSNIILATNANASNEIAEAEQDLQQKLNAAASTCSGIKNGLDTIFGLTVATTISSGAGTLAAGGALGVGIAKSVIDKKTEALEAQIQLYQPKSPTLTGNQSISLDAQSNVSGTEEEIIEKANSLMNEINPQIDELKKQIAENEKKSKTLGNVRTGLMAGATVTSLTSTVTSTVTTVKASELAEQMINCDNKIAEVRIAKSLLETFDVENNTYIEKAKKVLDSCTGFDKNNINTLKTTMTASAIISGIGSATAGTGTITSALANSQKIRNDNSDKGKKKEKGLNITSNILAGVTMGTSGASTVLSATSIERAKKDSSIAERCENALAN